MPYVWSLKDLIDVLFELVTFIDGFAELMWKLNVVLKALRLFLGFL